MDCYANWPLVLEYLKVLLSWPPVVVFLALALLPRFGTPLSNLIARIRKGKAAGFEFEADQEQLQAKAPPTSSLVPQGDQLTRISNDPALARAEILKWWLAAVSENVFHKIFGTQVRLLEFLLNKEPTGEPETNLAPFFIEHKKLAESAPVPVQASPTWDAFIGFLASSNLVYAETRDGIKYIRITDLGKRYLDYTKLTWGSYASTRAL